jgi:poly-gamma-glutamate synthesis protein (capsule biosynthesis protein)
MSLRRVNPRLTLGLVLLGLALVAPVVGILRPGPAPGNAPPSGLTTAARTTGSDAGQPNAAVAPPQRTPTRTTPAPASTPVARAFTVIGAGDVLLHSGLWGQAARDARAAGRRGYDFDPLFASLRAPVFSADLAICHLETPLGPTGGPFSNFPIFSVPPQVAGTLGRLGYDTCSTASNHSIDQGEAGVARTLDALDAAGVRHAGTARSPAEAAKVTMLLANGVRVAHLSYTFSFNGLRRPAGKDWLANALEPREVLAAARRARTAGAEVVIVSLHWGTEYQHAPNGYQIALARQLLADPAIDLILGHHAHVVQPLERIGDKWVAYGMGNEVAYQNFSLDTRDGIMPRFTFREVRPGVFRVVRAEVVPVHMWLDSRPVRVLDVAATIADPAAPDPYRRACRQSLQRIRAVLGQRGAYAAGLVLLG